MNLYNEDNTICKLYTETVNSITTVVDNKDSGWREGMPWLYYSRGTSQIMDSPNPDYKIRIGFPDDVLYYRLFEYDFEGNLLHAEILED